jgi:tetratricopeptide (TPR) repeat protein
LEANPVSRLTKQELKEDAFVTWVYDTTDKVQRNWVPVAVAIGTVVVLALGGWMWTRANAKREGEARTTLAEASTAYWSGNYVRTAQLADQVMADAGGTRAAVDAMRIKADALFWQGSFDSAATLYQQVLGKDKGDSPLRTATQQSLAFALESKRDFAPAAKLYEEVAAKAPDRANAADFYMAAGRAYRLAGQADKAKAMFEKVATEYKETSFARDAEVALGELAGEAP